MQHELETLQRRQSSLEDSLLEVMERREELQTQQASELATIDELQSELYRSAAGARRGARGDRSAATPIASRGATNSSPDWTPISWRCTSGSAPHGGPGAGRLQGRRCGACRIEIDRGELARISAAADDEVLRCPECGAILLRVKDGQLVKVIVEADGGSRGNPGPAGYGAVVWSADRRTVLAESKQAIGRATNNVAEYRGLIAGLEEAAKVGATEVDVSMDSKLVVEQMSGRWKVKHPDLTPLHRAGQGAVATTFDRITYAWIPRAKNCARRPAGQRGDGRRGRTGETRSG